MKRANTLERRSNRLEDQPLARIARYQEVVKDTIRALKELGFEVSTTDLGPPKCELHASRGKTKKEIQIIMDSEGKIFSDL